MEPRLNMTQLTPPLKWWGGKSYLAKRIIELMPPHTHYVEPFFGGGAVLLNKDPVGVSEVVNDVDEELTNFWQVLQEQEAFVEFQRRVDAMPFSEVEWEAAVDCSPRGVLDVDAAVQFFVRCRQSRAGRCTDFATLSKRRTRRQMNEQASAWMTAVEGLPAVASRLKRVVILCDDAMEIIGQEETDETLFYCDPPYLHESRVSTDDYAFEMTRGQHAELLETLKACTGKVMLSGYPSDLYNDELAGWRRVEFDIDNKASGAKTKPRMRECLWLNF